MSDGLKFCRDCKHYRPAWYGYGTRLGDDMCGSPQIEPDLVTGHGELSPSTCRSLDELCGRDARWFEVKVPPVIPQPAGFHPVEADKRPRWKIWGN